MLRYLGGGYFVGVPARDLSPADVAALPDGWTAARLVGTGRYAWTTTTAVVADLLAATPLVAGVPWRGFRRK